MIVQILLIVDNRIKSVNHSFLLFGKYFKYISDVIDIFECPNLKDISFIGTLLLNNKHA